MDRLQERLMRSEGLLSGLILKKPELYQDYDINKELLSPEALFYVGIVNRLLEKGIEVVDEVSFINEVNDLNLNDTYERMGGYSTIKELMSIVDIRNADMIVDDWRKWNLIKYYETEGILKSDKLFDKLTQMTSIQVEDYIIYKATNTMLKCVSGRIKEIDLTTGYDKAIEEWNLGNAIGYKLGFPIINYTLAGLHRGTLNLLLAFSGGGKTSFALPLAVLPIIESGEKMVIMANEQDEMEWRQMLLATVMFNRIKYYGMNRQKFLYGNFSEKDREALRESSKWLEQYSGNLTFVEMKDYNIDNIRRIIKKYSKIGFNTMLVDTLKPTDETSDKSWAEFSETSKELFLLAKQCDVALLCTAQLATNSYGKKYLDINSIGKSRAIAEVAAQILMFRDIKDQEKENLKVWKKKRDENTGKLTNKNEIIKLDKDKDYIVLFVAKNRFGESNVQLVYEKNMSFNQYYEVGFTSIQYDGFGGK
ncbi:putative replicative DNA helicase [[Clostridium] sordellii]|uniref:DnaB-like helicase C-terminal domain-containing protein n=1 Tax=Paraclostridium sordellii TaxID=1505 RepID=UPI0005E86F05|nr:DnaB-like helicase C-terminal domain-containing protein [Paeniclostridium sordellii]CEQ01633.1 putative replicative DNA helicase [[Clostridium] sordellii] [Paeniclostridium sordellii]